MKATIEHNGTVVSLEDNEGTIEQVIEMFEQALLGCGFKFNGRLEIVEPEG